MLMQPAMQSVNGGKRFGRFGFRVELHRREVRAWAGRARRGLHHVTEQDGRRAPLIEGHLDLAFLAVDEHQGLKQFRPIQWSGRQQRLSSNPPRSVYDIAGCRGCCKYPVRDKTAVRPLTEEIQSCSITGPLPRHHHRHIVWVEGGNATASASSTLPLTVAPPTARLWLRYQAGVRVPTASPVGNRTLSGQRSTAKCIRSNRTATGCFDRSQPIDFTWHRVTALPAVTR